MPLAQTIIKAAAEQRNRRGNINFLRQLLKRQSFHRSVRWLVKVGFSLRPLEFLRSPVSSFSGADVPVFACTRLFSSSSSSLPCRDTLFILHYKRFGKSTPNDPQLSNAVHNSRMPIIARTPWALQGVNGAGGN